MNIAIIGTGFTGLGAALELIKKGHLVTIFESSPNPGGLAGGFRADSWSWPLEHHYHHLFGTDTEVQALGRLVGCPTTPYQVNSSTFYRGQFYRLDNPVDLLKFPLLGWVDKLRTGATLAFFKIWPFWQVFETTTSDKLLNTLMGKQSFDILWRPLFEKKFHTFWSQISAVWFWARIKFRTPALSYPDGGFLNLANNTVAYLQRNQVDFHFKTPVLSIKKTKSGYQVTTSKSSQNFDCVISTLPVSATQKIAPFYHSSGHIDSLGAVNLVLELKKPFLPNHIYWLNVNDMDLPFLAVVEHTNFITSDHYGRKPLIYIGNYLPSSHKYFGFNSSQMLQEYLPGLKKINSEFTADWVNKSWIFKTAYAQSIVTPNFQSHLPPLTTDFPGFFVANIQQVYPQDRGVNYAIKLGFEVAKYVN
jgi:protoporphyrinogen oxidase